MIAEQASLTAMRVLMTLISDSSSSQPDPALYPRRNAAALASMSSFSLSSIRYAIAIAGLHTAHVLRASPQSTIPITRPPSTKMFWSFASLCTTLHLKFPSSCKTFSSKSLSTLSASSLLFSPTTCSTNPRSFSEFLKSQRWVLWNPGWSKSRKQASRLPTRDPASSTSVSDCSTSPRVLPGMKSSTLIACRLAGSPSPPSSSM
mmetsp:Transcript_5022/g.17644  ORF Transcript_5022/g.17644 Transcript_5022/m.17644 type:complete len:204 (-) Transcript_5022:486-1097(-)